MTRDDIIKLARDAGIEVHARKGEIRIGSAAITGCDSTEQVTRFAALVAAAEREACAQVCIEHACKHPYPSHAGAAATVCAAAIRARSSNASD